MQDELNALAKIGTRKIVVLPSNVKPIGCKWIYKVKHHYDGYTERYKAIFVAKGYYQIKGLDYFDTYSPVTKLTTVIIVISLASMHHWHLHQLNVNNSFFMENYRKITICSFRLVFHILILIKYVNYLNLFMSLSKQA
jgi:hypothetical protein